MCRGRHRFENRVVVVQARGGRGGAVRDGSEQGTRAPRSGFLGCERSVRLNTLCQQIFFEKRVLYYTENSVLEAHKESTRDPRPEVQAPGGLLVLGSLSGVGSIVVFGVNAQ